VKRRGAWVLVLLGGLVACGEEFPNEPSHALTIQVDAAFPDTLTVTDTTTFQVHISDSLGDSITGIEVNWQSSDAAVLEVRQPSASTPLTERLTTQALAHGRGSAGVIVTVNRAGFAPAELRSTATVLERWTSIGAGASHSCAVAFSGELDCWGASLLGSGTTGSSPIPVPVAGGLTFDSVSAGIHTCALARGTGIVYCWGQNGYGEVGNGSQFDQLTPDQVSLGQTFQSVSAGVQYSCGLAQSGIAYCWGRDGLGQLGDFSPEGERPFPDPLLSDCDGDLTRCALTPVPVRVTKDLGQALHFLSIDAGPRFFTCGVRTDRSAACWGKVPLVTPAIFNGFPPCEGSTCIWTVPGNHDFTSVATGVEHACGTAGDKSVYCWGVNLFGELGRQGPDDSTPTQVAGGRSYSQVTAGRRFTCGLTVESKVVCWGSNDLGQLGNPASAGEPVEVQGGLEFKTLSAGFDHTCGITSTGAAFCWGSNENGQLGVDPGSELESCGGTPCSRIPRRVREPASVASTVGGE
jgi:alpha-tubulin suppressor-like RCC1 family protein